MPQAAPAAIFAIFRPWSLIVDRRFFDDWRRFRPDTIVARGPHKTVSQKESRKFVGHWILRFLERAARLGSAEKWNITVVYTDDPSSQSIDHHAAGAARGYVSRSPGR